MNSAMYFLLLSTFKQKVRGIRDQVEKLLLEVKPSVQQAVVIYVNSHTYELDMPKPWGCFVESYDKCSAAFIFELQRVH